MDGSVGQSADALVIHAHLRREVLGADPVSRPGIEFLEEVLGRHLAHVTHTREPLDEYGLYQVGIGDGLDLDGLRGVTLARAV